MIYDLIFFTNVNKYLEQRNLKKNHFAEVAEISYSMLNLITKGRGNPSLAVMEKIARALEVPLPVLLDTSDLSDKDIALIMDIEPNLLERLTSGGLPKGYEWPKLAPLPSHKAYQVQVWAEETKEELKKIIESKDSNAELEPS